MTAIAARSIQTGRGPLYTWHYMPLTAEHPTSSRTSVFAISLASVLLLGLAAGGIWCMGQVAMAPSTVPAYMAVDNTSHASLSSSTHAPRLRLSSSGPTWRELSETQRQILMPLREHWNAMGALAKRRWLVLADRYPKMDESERTKLVSRMTTWASLSAQQRNQARLNFESTKRLSAQELQTKWDEYQALSAAEKQRLAEQARKARAAKKAKRRIAVPKLQPAPAPSTPTVSHPVIVETQPIATPQAAPALQLPPVEHPQPAFAAPPEVTALPITVPQSMPSMELPPLPAEDPAPAQDLDAHQSDPAPEHAPAPAQ